MAVATPLIPLRRKRFYRVRLLRNRPARVGSQRVVCSVVGTNGERPPTAALRRPRTPLKVCIARRPTSTDSMSALDSPLRCTSRLVSGWRISLWLACSEVCRSYACQKDRFPYVESALRRQTCQTQCGGRRQTLLDAAKIVSSRSSRAVRDRSKDRGPANVRQTFSRRR